METIPREVLLVGSVPLRPAANVFETVARHLGTLAPRIPDGEQIGWVFGAFQSFAENPSLEPNRKVPLDAGGALLLTTYRLRPGLQAKDLELGPYGFAENAIASYAQFKALKDSAKIPTSTRFQVTMPGPGTSSYVIELPAEQLLPLAREALGREIDRIVAAIPSSELSIQLDVAMEAEHEEYLRRPNVWNQPIHKVFHWTLEQMADSVAWLANRIPPEVELGFHICSIWHHDTGAGQDNAVLVDAANTIKQRLQRPVGYLHLPVIPEHTAGDYAAFQRLEFGRGTKLYLGLLNLADGLEGAKRRIALARAAVPEFGVAMFCGLGRAPAPGAPLTSNQLTPPIPALRRATADTIGEVLELHKAAALLE